MNHKLSGLIQPIKILVTLLLLGWLGKMLYQADLQQYLENVNYALLLSACAIHLLAYGILFVRWRNILAIFYQLPYKQLIDSYYIGLFSNNFIPTTVGGDLVRISYLFRQGLQPARLLLSAVVDRLLGLIATLTIAVSSALLFPLSGLKFEFDSSQLFFIGAAVSALVVASIFLFIVIVVRAQWKRKALSIISNLLYRLRQIIAAVHGQSPRLSIGILLSFAGTISVVACYYVLAQALTLSIPLTALLFVVPISYVPASLPISIGGLGVREGSIVFLLSLFDVPIEQGLALTAAYLFVLIVVTAPGGILILRRARPSLVEGDKAEINN